MGERKFSDIFEVTPTITAGAYTSGDVVGGVLTLNDVDDMKSISGVISTFIICDVDKQAINFDMILFAQEPTNGTYTDNAVIDVDVADIPFSLGVVSIDEHHDLGTTGISQDRNQNMVYRNRTDNNLYVIPVVRGAPTYTTTTSLTFKFGYLED